MADPTSVPGWLSAERSADDYTVCGAGTRIAFVVADRAQAAVRLLSNCVDVSPDKRSSVPVLAGTRFPVARLLAELAEGDRSVDQLVEDFDLDPAVTRSFLEGLSMYLDRPALP